ncbi:hypothetical protein HDU89_005007 [Geranomyces variabilis]|nr:hypothetical protein HDU89_005007 [Geranomyces variabilis]
MVAASLVPYLAAFTRHAIPLMAASFAAPLVISTLSQNEKPAVFEKPPLLEKPPFHPSFIPVVIGVVALLVDCCLLNTPLTWLHINTVTVMGALLAMDGMTSTRTTPAKFTGSGTGTIEWSAPWAPLLVLVGFGLICTASGFAIGASRWLRENPTPLLSPQELHPAFNLGLPVVATAFCLWGVFAISDKDGMPPTRVWTMRALFLVQLVPVWWTFLKPTTPAVSLA